MELRSEKSFLNKIPQLVPSTAFQVITVVGGHQRRLIETLRPRLQRGRIYEGIWNANVKCCIKNAVKDASAL